MNTIVIDNVEIKYPKVGCDMQQILKMLGEEKTITFAKNMQVIAPHLYEVTADSHFSINIYRCINYNNEILNDFSFRRLFW